MKYVRIIILTFLFISFGLFSSCDENGDFLLFSIQDDIDLGQQVADEIESMPDEFPILSRTEYSEAYAILDGMLNEILASEDVTYRDEFAWEVTIIDDDQTLNAFATPGGYIYVYTGLIYFLDREDDLAGVLGHEVAHSDQRHSSKQLQREYGISVLLSIISGDNTSALNEIVGNLVSSGAILSFSRSAEREADDFSVEYLEDTKYACNAAAAFFQKLIDRDEAGDTPVFLSTHPDSDDRVEAINEKAIDIGCNTTPDDDGSNLVRLQSLLP